MNRAPRTLGPGPLPGGPSLPAPGAAVPDVWLVRVGDHPATEAGLALLDDDERKHHAAFLRPADRERYAASHIALRRLLGAYLDRDPAGVALGRDTCPTCGGPHGRPVVADGGDGVPHFSLSHSGDLALLAFAAVPVGADVETLPALSSVNDIAGALHPRERDELAALPDDDRRVAFARCWVRKEAYLKGTGHGLSAGLDTRYVGTGPTPAALPGWTLTDVPVPFGHCAAIAHRSPE